ncbi:Hypothetical protein CINCED_3A009369 [Cinara cedri]|uniref:Strictosidine synthase conserved region domain-containing protein n=1 Tax=Cinara cedri TaxID=506608 RepID=A0A5E4MJ19_9HEMI|nr:Hypothetical protein CINCED_3A009369 [Cinara cedri]
MHVQPQRSLIGPLQLNQKLFGISKLYENQIKGPEGLLYHNNTLYLTLHYGHVVKIVDNQIVPVVKFGKVCDGLYEEHICGRPLGLKMDNKGFLYVVDAYYGIFKVNIHSPVHYGAKEQIVSMDQPIEGVRPKFPNSVTIASDGTIYWTDSDTNFKLHDGVYTLLADGSGRLLKYDPKTKQNTVLMDKMQFPNGVELSNDESFLLIAETFKYRIIKYHLKGQYAGHNEIFIDGLPGMPDNIKKNAEGSFYFPLVMSRKPFLENIGQYPTLRMMILKFLSITEHTIEMLESFYPSIYFKKSIHWIGHFESLSFMKKIFDEPVSIIEVNEKGTIKSSWYSTGENVTNICDFEVIGENVYLGSPYNSFLGVLKLPRGFFK